MRERKLAARIRENNPAAKRNRCESGRDQKHQGAADAARIFLQLFRTHEVEGRFPMRQRFPYFRGNKGSPPITAGLARRLSGNRSRFVVQEREHIVRRAIFREGAAPEIAQCLNIHEATENHPGRFRRPDPETNLKTILHKTRHHAFRMIGSKCLEIRGRRDHLRNARSIFLQLTLRSDVAQLRGLVCFVLVLRRGSGFGFGHRCLSRRVRRIVIFSLALLLAPLFRAIQFLRRHGVDRRRRDSGQEGAVVLQKLLPFRVASRFLCRGRDEVALWVQSKSNCRTCRGARELRGEIAPDVGSPPVRQQLAHSFRKRAPLVLDDVPRRARNGICLLLVELRGPTFENDLLLVRAPQSQPSKPDARQHNGQEKYPDASFHEARRRVACCRAHGRNGAATPRIDLRGRPARRPSARPHRLFWYLSA